MLPLPPIYLVNPAVAAAALVNIFPLPETIVEAVLLLLLNIKLALVGDDALM